MDFTKFIQAGDVVFEKSLVSLLNADWWTKYRETPNFPPLARNQS